MHKVSILPALVLSLLAGLSPAHAGIDHAFVASNGSDANDCSRATPCGSFAGAYAKVSTGGEIICVDAGFYGSLQISMSVTVNCEASRGNNAVTNGSDGVHITTSATDVVVLRGLDVDGILHQCAPGFPGGIYFNGAGALHIHKTKLNSWIAQCNGLYFNATGPAKLFITDTIITDNGGSAGTAGLMIHNQSSNILNVTITNDAINNNFNGIITSVSGNGGIFFTVADTVVAGNTQNGITTITSAGGITSTLDNVKVLHNGGYGISPNGSNTATRLSRSLVVGNLAGLYTSGGGQFLTYQDNRIDGNFTNISGPALTPTGLK